MPKATHTKVCVGLLQYADKNGLCWPGFRTLAERVCMSLGAVQRAVKELASLGYIEIERRGKGRSNLYHLRFGRFEGRRVRPPPETPRLPPDPQLCFDFGPGSVSPASWSVPPQGTEGVAKERVDFIKKEQATLRRDAPFVDSPPSEPEPELTAERRKARQVAVTTLRWGYWLKGMHSWIGRRLEGDQRMEAWAAVAVAVECGSRQLTPTATRKLLDSLSEIKKLEAKGVSVIIPKTAPSPAEPEPEPEPYPESEYFLDLKNLPVNGRNVRIRQELERRYATEQLEVFYHALRHGSSDRQDEAQALWDHIGREIDEAQSLAA